MLIHWQHVNSCCNKLQQLSAFSNHNNYLSSSSLAHFWFPTVQDVLHADWQDAWHLPQPPFFADSLKFALFNVWICFMISSILSWVLNTIIYSILPHPMKNSTIWRKFCNKYFNDPNFVKAKGRNWQNNLSAFADNRNQDKQTTKPIPPN